MNTVLENAIGVAVFGLLLAAAFGYAAVQIGQRNLLIVATSIAALTMTLAAVSHLVQTPREQLVEAIEAVADAVRANDIDRAISFVHPNAKPIEQRARTEMSSYTFLEAKVTSIRSVDINQNSKPATATTEFVARIKVRGDQRIYGMQGTAIRLLKVYWLRSGDRWLVNDYEHFDVRDALAN
jgi:iron uptake system EfeUOB component EfeO/EfeM